MPGTPSLSATSGASLQHLPAHYHNGAAGAARPAAHGEGQLDMLPRVTSCQTLVPGDVLVEVPEVILLVDALR